MNDVLKMTNEMSLFERAAVNKYRFSTSAGEDSATIEDLFDLPLTDNRRIGLDDLYRLYKNELKTVSEDSYVHKAKKVSNSAAQIMEDKLEIVKRVIDLRMTAADRSAKLKERKEKRTRLMEVLAQKKDQEVQSKSVEELMAMIDDLSD